MSGDEELKIRHVRLCQCGKPAEHDSICRPGRTPAGLDPDDVERVDAAFEETTSQYAEGRYQRRKREFDSERRQARAGMDAFALHRWVIEHQVALSTVAAGNTEPTRSATGDTAAPPRQQLLDDDPRWREHMSVIRRRLELAADLIDEAEGHSTVSSTANMLGVEKDKLILDAANQGLRAQAVVDRLGSHIAGSAETVRRVRRAAGQDHLGHDREPGPGDRSGAV